MIYYILHSRFRLAEGDRQTCTSWTVVATTTYYELNRKRYDTYSIKYWFRPATALLTLFVSHYVYTSSIARKIHQRTCLRRLIQWATYARSLIYLPLILQRCIPVRSTQRYRTVYTYSMSGSRNHWKCTCIRRYF